VPLCFKVCAFFYVAPLGLCSLIFVFYEYVTPLGLMNAHHFYIEIIFQHLAFLFYKKLRAFVSLCLRVKKIAFTRLRV
jgi:hypothetical protein